MWGQDVDAVLCRAPREQDMEEASKIKLTMANTRWFGFHNFGWEIDQNFDVHELCLVIHLYTYVYNLTRLIIKLSLIKIRLVF
jgi:hypothetical protein